MTGCVFTKQINRAMILIHKIDRPTLHTNHTKIKAYRDMDGDIGEREFHHSTESGFRTGYFAEREIDIHMPIEVFKLRRHMSVKRNAGENGKHVREIRQISNKRIRNHGNYRKDQAIQGFNIV